MIHFTPPESIHLIGPLQINSHGVFFLIGALAAFFWTRKRAPEEYRESIEGVLPYMTVGGVLGARLAFVAMNPSTVTGPLDLFKVWQGGLISYGGLVGAVLAWLLYLKARGLPVALLTEAMAPTCLLGWGIGRIGCLLNWANEWGVETSVPWAFIGPDGVPRHPVMLYQALMLILAAPLAAWLGRRFGSATGWSLMLYGIARYLGDGFRDYDPVWLRLSSQATAATLFSLGLVLFLLRKRGSSDSSGASPAR